MELRDEDPKLLIPNPYNPRRTAAPAMSDQQLRASIASFGLLQPPLCRDTEAGLRIIAGSRRVRECIALKLPRIPVLVGTADMSDDAILAALVHVSGWIE